MPKPPFSHAPDFTLPGASGPFRLNDLEGRHRVALLFTRGEAQAREAMAQFQNGRDRWGERDLVLVLVLREETTITAPLGVFVTRDERGQVAREFGVSEDETAFFLLGKSRFPVTLAVDCLPGDAEIFALIDAMPMRQREMRERAS